MAYFGGHKQIRVACLLANRADAYALERAKKFAVPTYIFDKDTFVHSDDVDVFLMDHGVTSIVLAGFLWLIPARLLAKFPRRVINIHPALLPAFGGKGMWGHHVHQAVSHASVGESGITIHLADGAYDEGQILRQVRVQIAPFSTPAIVEAAIRPLELAYYAPTIEQYLLEQLMPQIEPDIGEN